MSAKNPLQEGSTRLRLFKVLHNYPTGLTQHQIKEMTGMIRKSGHLAVVLAQEIKSGRIKKLTRDLAGRELLHFMLTEKGEKDLEKGRVDSRKCSRIGTPWSKAKWDSSKNGIAKTSKDGEDWDRASVRQLYENDANVRILLDHMAERHRVPKGSITKVDRLVGDLHFDRITAIKVLRKLARHGCGTFKIGRRGKVSRIKWGVSPIIIAKIAREAESQEFGSATTQQPEDAQFVEQRFQLRPNVAALVTVPLDMTRDEAERLAGVVRNIWFHGPSTN